MKIISRIALLVPMAGLAGCGGKPTPMTKGCTGVGCGVVVTSHYNADFSGTGTLNVLKLPEKTVTAGVDATLDPDTALTVVGTNLWVLSATSGALRRYDALTLTNQIEIPTGDADHPSAASGPAGLYIADPASKVYVTLAYNDAAHALAVLDPSQPTKGVVKYIALPQLVADGDGSPEAGAIYGCNGKLHILMGDRTIAGRDVTYHGGRIVSVDTATDAVTGTITLMGTGAADIQSFGSDCAQVLVATSGDLTTVPDGTTGIERVDLTAGQSRGWLVRDTDLGGRPFALVEASAGLGFVGMYSDPQTGMDGKVYLASSKVAAFDPTTGAGLVDVSGKAGFISFITIAPNRQLVLGVGNFSGTAEPAKLDRGIYVGPADGTALPTSGPIDLADTPSAIAFF